MTIGIIYLMTSAVRGLVKIGKCETSRYEQRMRELENNGYFNVAGLKRLFAIEVEDYDAKEKMLHELFEKARLDNSELFAINKDLVVELLSSFEGIQVFPKPSIKSKEVVFDEASTKVEATIEKRAKRKYFGVTLETLISEEFLIEDEPITSVHDKYPGTGSVTSDGISYDGITDSVSSSAHRCVKKIRPDINAPNGWTFWGVIRGDEVLTLDQIRAQYLDMKNTD